MLDASSRDKKMYYERKFKDLVEDYNIPSSAVDALIRQYEGSNMGKRKDPFTMRQEMVQRQAYMYTPGPPKPETPPSVEALKDAKDQIDELTEVLERIQKEPLMLQKVDRISPDKKWCYVKKMNMELRVEAVKDLKRGDEVLLHPKSLQIVEHLGKPPLEASKFCPNKIPDITWDDIGGLEDAKADMIEAIEMPLLHDELFKRYNKRLIKGIMLSGPPGCGKTMLGKAAANSIARIHKTKAAKTGFMYIKGPEVLNKFVGETEETIRDIFDDAKRHKEEHGYPAIIFIDEADAILATRGSRVNGLGATVVPAFLTEMDGLDDSAAIVIIATNRPDVLDPAIVRDGRIDRKIEIPRPDEKNASIIIQHALKGVPLQKGISIETFADAVAEIAYADDRMVGDQKLRDIINGAMLVGIIDIAVSNAIRREIAGKGRKGLQEEDIMFAIARQQHHNKDQSNYLEKAA
jgi:proteasome ATPase